jgi:hypothetical protein
MREQDDGTVSWSYERSGSACGEHMIESGRPNSCDAEDKAIFDCVAAAISSGGRSITKLHSSFVGLFSAGFLRYSFAPLLRAPPSRHSGGLNLCSLPIECQSSLDRSSDTLNHNWPYNSAMKSLKPRLSSPLTVSLDSNTSLV